MTLEKRGGHFQWGEMMVNFHGGRCWGGGLRDQDLFIYSGEVSAKNSTYGQSCIATDTLFVGLRRRIEGKRGRGIFHWISIERGSTSRIVTEAFP